MTAPFHMIKTVPDERKLTAWAHRNDWMVRSSDLGYALHAALKSAFGEDAPKRRSFSARRGC